MQQDACRKAYGVDIAVSFAGGTVLCLLVEALASSSLEDFDARGVRAVAAVGSEGSEGQGGSDGEMREHLEDEDTGIVWMCRSRRAEANGGCVRDDIWVKEVFGTCYVTYLVIRSFSKKILINKIS